MLFKNIIRNPERGVRRGENVKGISGDRADKKTVMERCGFQEEELEKGGKS